MNVGVKVMVKQRAFEGEDPLWLLGIVIASPMPKSKVGGRSPDLFLVQVFSLTHPKFNENVVLNESDCGETWRLAPL